jgi:hypothetical protein
MLAKVTSCALVGLDGVPVEVEVDTSRGMPSLTIVGLPDAAVKESGERVRSALKNASLVYPGKRITVNLAPADIRKAGPAYDLPIAVGILIASEQAWPQAVEDALIVGELSLDGSVRHVDGILPIAAMARQEGLETVFVPATRRRPRSLRGWMSSQSSTWAIWPPTSRACARFRPTTAPWIPTPSRPRNTRPISLKLKGRNTSSGRWRSRPPARTMC